MTPRAPARGLVLLEVLLAISIFVISGLVILSALAEGVELQRQTRDRQRLVDLARTAVALIESGAATAETLNGPVRAWPASLTDSASSSEPPPAGGPRWELRIQTQPWGGGGLTLLTVEALRSDSERRMAPDTSRDKSPGAGGDNGAMSFVLHQLVRIGGARGSAGGARP